MVYEQIRQFRAFGYLTPIQAQAACTRQKEEQAKRDDEVKRQQLAQQEENKRQQLAAQEEQKRRDIAFQQEQLAKDAEFKRQQQSAQEETQRQQQTLIEALRQKAERDRQEVEANRKATEDLQKAVEEARQAQAQKYLQERAAKEARETLQRMDEEAKQKEEAKSQAEEEEKVRKAKEAELAEANKPINKAKGAITNAISNIFSSQLPTSFESANLKVESYGSASLIADASGALYGTTMWGGGGGGCPPRGCGTVFKLTPPSPGGGPWTETVLHSFTNVNGDGALPLAGLIFDASGALYGTTAYGGGTNCACGTVFKLTPPSPGGGPWTETVLHSFIGGSDGSEPLAGLIFDASGALYGTTLNGGGSGTNCAASTGGCGTVFKLTPTTTTTGTTWTESVLYSFTGGSDGGFPLPA
jgi:hypothetical protein